MLLTINPFSIVLPTVWPCVDPVAVLPIEDVLAFISLAVRRFVISLTMLLAIQPRTVVLAAIRPNALTLSLDLVIVELPCVMLSIGPCEGTLTGSRAMFVVAYVL